MRDVSVIRRSRPAANPIATRLRLPALFAGSLLLVAGAVGLWRYTPASGTSGGAGGPGLFVDMTLESGLDFVHYNGTTGELLLPEIMGAGGALFDHDNDGDLDLFAVQGAALKPGERAGAVPSPAPSRPRGRLFRNDLRIDADAARTLRFTDVTEQSGIDAGRYGMGVATGDFNNDGCVDLYVTNLGPNQMFRNNCNGTFTDVSRETATGDPRWSTSAVFFDYDRDGWLDLFVANYVDFTADMTRECFSRGSARDDCNPAVYAPVPGRLFHNRADGTFSDVSVPSGVTEAFGAGLGVVAADLNRDGWTDLYVANDGQANQLWINERGSGRFKNDGPLAGVAFNRTGQAQGSMGVDAGDFDGDGDEDLFVTNLDHESGTVYVNLGNGRFEDRTIEAGLLLPTLGFTGFGTRFFDYDNDGWLDLLVVNGSVSLVEKSLKQHNQLFRNHGGRFIDVTMEAGPAFKLPELSRGAAVGDLDNDGDTDVVVFNNNGPVRVLLNEAGSRRHWLGARVIDGRYRRDGLQAPVELLQRQGGSLWRRVQTDGSYLSASDPRVLFGLGGDGSPRTIRVHWPEGRVDEFQDLAVDRYWVLESGKAPR
jgi:hypothetical protein